MDGQEMVTDQERDSEISYYHLDYYVRRFEGELVLVETLLKQSAHAPDESEIVTFYIAQEDLEPDWVDALLEQGEDLEEGQSMDFVPPDEMI